MSEVEKLISVMNDDLYQKLLLALEIGKWENGSRLTPAQLSSTQQLVLLYQAKRLDQDEHLTISSAGTINHLSKNQLKKQFVEEIIAEFKEADL